MLLANGSDGDGGVGLGVGSGLGGITGPVVPPGRVVFWLLDVLIPGSSKGGSLSHSFGEYSGLGLKKTYHAPYTNIPPTIKTNTTIVIHSGIGFLGLD